MKRLLLAAILICGPTSFALAGLEGASGPTQTTPPNIVLIVADDLGFNDIKWDDGVNYKMSNLASLAQDGTRFNRFYATPVCSPTRAALLTGRSPIRWGHLGSVIYSTSDGGTPRTEEMLPEMLEDLGYNQRFVAGKWHLGNRFQKFNPTNSGFTQFFGSYNGAVEYYSKVKGMFSDWRADTVGDFQNLIPDTAKYHTDVIGDKAVEFIDAHFDEPFLLYVPFQAAHFPKVAPQALVDYFEDPLNGFGLTPTEAVHLAMIASLDENIGKILDALDNHMIEDNTIVWYLTDNGGLESEGADNSPLAGGKGSVADGGIRVQSVLRYPGKVPAGVINSDLISHVDVLPTLREYIRREIGTLPPPINVLDGRNMTGFIEGTESKANLDGKEHFVLRQKRNNDPTEIPTQALLSYDYNGGVSPKLWKLVWTGEFDYAAYLAGSSTATQRLYDVLATPADIPGSAEVVNLPVEQSLVAKMNAWMILRPADAGFPLIDLSGYLFLPNWDYRDQRTDPGERHLIYRESALDTVQKIGSLNSQGILVEFNNTGNAPDGFPGLMLQGIGRSHVDGLLYGVDSNGTDPVGVNLYQLDGTETALPMSGFGGQVMRLGTIKGIPLGANITAGDVHPDGKEYYCFDDSSDTFYRVELRNLVATPLPLVMGVFPTDVNIQDFAFNSQGEIVAFDEKSKRVFTVALLSNGDGLVSASAFRFLGLKNTGAAWVDIDDNLLVYHKGSVGTGRRTKLRTPRGLYHLDLSSGALELVSSVPGLLDIDGGGTAVGP